MTTLEIDSNKTLPVPRVVSLQDTPLRSGAGKGRQNAWGPWSSI
jgi:hypothetical protein